MFAKLSKHLQKIGIRVRRSSAPQQQVKKHRKDWKRAALEQHGAIKVHCAMYCKRLGSEKCEDCPLRNHREGIK